MATSPGILPTSHIPGLDDGTMDVDVMLNTGAGTHTVVPPEESIPAAPLNPAPLSNEGAMEVDKQVSSTSIDSTIPQPLKDSTIPQPLTSAPTEKIVKAPVNVPKKSYSEMASGVPRPETEKGQCSTIWSERPDLYDTDDDSEHQDDDPDCPSIRFTAN